MKKLLSFVSYNNAVPLMAVVLFLGASATFAATSGVVSLPAAAASSSAAVQAPAPDVSYLLSVDLDSYMPTAQVTGITEDSDNYYVAYTLSTIALVGNAWQQTTEDETMTISKAAIGAYQDLGLYVAAQLQARTAQELSYLQRVQTVARDSASGTQAASAYASLIGKTLDADSSAIPGYVPVVVPEIAQTTLQAPVAAAAAPQTQPPAIEAVSDSATAAPATTTVPDADDDSSVSTSSSPAASESDTQTSADATSTAAATGAIDPSSPIPQPPEGISTTTAVIEAPAQTSDATTTQITQ